MTPRAGRRLVRGALVLIGVAACRTAAPPPEVTTAPTDPTSTPPVVPTPTPWLLIDRQATEGVQRAALEWATAAGVAAEATSLEIPLESLDAGLAAAVVAEGHLAALELAAPGGEIPVVVFDASSVTPSETRSTIGPTVAYDEAGFLAGLAAGLTSSSGVVGVFPGPGTDDASEFRSGFEEGLLYSCPRCQLVVADLGQPAFAMDVVGLPPASELPASVTGSDVPWLVVVGASPSEVWAAHVAARIRAAPEALIGDALGALMAGDPGEAWVLAASNGSLVTEIDHRAISPGRERLLREAETALAQGFLVVGIGPP